MSNKCIDNDRVSDYYTNVSNSYSNYTKYGVSMTYTNRHKAAAFVSRAAKIAALVLLAAGLAACPPEPEADLSIGAITIYNIPVVIEVNGNETVKNNTFKVFVSASNDQEADKPPVAQGFMLIEDDMLQADGTYTITIPLRIPVINLKPLPDGSPNPNNPPGHVYDPNLDPNDDLGPWRGTAAFFSVMISPQVTTKVLTDWEEDAIEAKGGFTFDRSKERLNWMDSGLMPFRDHPKLLGEQNRALYTDIILRDPQLRP